MTKTLLEKWVVRTNAISAALLLIVAISCTAIGGVNHEFNVTTDMVGIHHTQFGVGPTLAYASIMEASCRLWTAFAPGVTIRVMEYRSMSVRFPLMALSFPALNAAVLVGLAAVGSIWALFSIVCVSLLLLMSVWMTTCEVKPSKTQYTITLLSIALYVSAWGIAIKTSQLSVPLGLVCYLLVSSSIWITFVVMRACVTTTPAYTEALASSFCNMLYTLPPCLWVTQMQTDFLLAPWIVLLILAGVLIGIATYVVCTIPRNHKSDALNEPLKGEISSDDDDDGEVFELTTDPYKAVAQSEEESSLPN